MAIDEKPKILIIVNNSGWAHDHKTRNLQRTLGAKYHIIKKYQAEVTELDLEDADLIQVYYWMQFQNMQNLDAAFKRHSHKLLIGVSGHVGLENERREPGLAWLRRARAVFAINQLLYKEVTSLINVPVFYTPNGVDTKFFTPAPVKQQGRMLRVGWGGSLDNHGPEQRGFNNLIVPAINAVAGVELATAIRGDRWRTHEEMVEFYRSLDVYICASRNEGSPNPCLEAAACGIPVISTRVGNMPELITPGVNGYFIEPEVADIARVLTILRDDEPHREQLSQAIRASILDWDWDLLSNNYHQMYQYSLAMISAENYKSLNEEYRINQISK